MKVEGVDFNLPRLVGSDLSTRRTLQRHRTPIPQLILQYLVSNTRSSSDALNTFSTASSSVKVTNPILKISTAIMQPQYRQITITYPLERLFLWSFTI